MRAERFAADILEFMRVLEAHRVRWLLIGGHAVFLHGYPRLTADVDFAYAPDPENARRLYGALLEFWGGSVPAVNSADELAQEGMIFQFGVPPNRIDLLSRVSGISFDAAWARRIEVEVLGGPAPLTIPVISLADLRAAKRAAGRPKDLDDLENLPLDELPPD